MIKRAKWQGGWRNTRSGAVRIKFLPASISWGVYIADKLVSKHGGRSAAKAHASRKHANKLHRGP